jgi:ATP-binding cassette subfamily F protein uup
LSDYKGTIIVVSHDRDFLERLVTRTLVFEGEGKIVDLVGGYEDYLQFYKNAKPDNV